MTSVRSPFATPSERLATYFNDQQSRTAFDDREIDDVALLLEQCGHVASKCPRTYILFRTIGQLDTIEQLVKVGFSDQWFPVETRSLPSFLDPSIKSAVVQRQGIILTKSLDLENGRHRHFAPEEVLPFDILGRLGSGGYGQVDRIVSKTSYRQFALKRIRRRAAFGNGSSREALKGFLNEMKIMRSLKHRHIVQYIGSYTDKSYLGLVMSPVAETDLAVYTEYLCAQFHRNEDDRIPSPFFLQGQPPVVEMSANLRTFFGCLTAALSYLHDQNIRHKDIKPQNILVSRGNVLFSDFGLSREFADDVGSTTSGVTPASPRYCAPEVASYEARNTSSDIWSLGCVFLEMTAALQGMNIDGIKEYFTKSQSPGTHFHANPTATAKFVQELKTTGDRKYKRALTWTEKMIIVDRAARPTAAQVLEMITMHGPSDHDSTPNMFCGICCVPDLESDSLDSLADDIDTIPAVLRRDSGLKDTLAQQPSRKPDSTPENALESTKLAGSSVHPEEDIAVLEPSTTGPNISATSLPESSSSSLKNAPRATSASTSSSGDGTPQSLAVPTNSSMTSRTPTNQGSEPATLIAGLNLNDNTSPGRVTPPPENAHLGEGKILRSSSMFPSLPIISKDAVTGESLLKGAVTSIRTKPELEKEIAPKRGSVSAAVHASENLSPDLKQVGSSSKAKAVPTTDSKKVFGVPLSISIKYAFIQLSKFETIGGSFLEGPIPIIIFKCCEFIKNGLGAARLDSALMIKDHIRLSNSLLYTFDDADFGLEYQFAGHEYRDCGRLFYHFMKTLPDAIIPHQVFQTIVQVWARDISSMRKIKAIERAILGTGAPYRICSLYLLDFFARCSLLSSQFKTEAAEMYCLPFMVAPDRLQGRLLLYRNRHIMNFLIDNAKSLLRGEIPGMLIPPGDSIPAPRQDSPDTLVATPSDLAKNFQKAVDLAKASSRIAPSSANKVDESRTDPDTEYLTKQLRLSGVTQSHSEKFSQYVKTYIKQSHGRSGKARNQGVFGIPIWISAQYASVDRSTYVDFGTNIAFRGRVPIVVAECCKSVFLAANTNDLYRFNDFSEASQPKLAELGSIFDSYPSYGENRPWLGYTSSHLGTTLFVYLESLPEPLIPEHIAKRIFHEVPSAFNSFSPQHDRLATFLSILSQAPKPNYDTLLYLLAFFYSLGISYDHLTIAVKNFSDIFIKFRSGTDPSFKSRTVQFMMQHAYALLRKSPGTRYVGKSANRRQISAPFLNSSNAQSPPPEHVTALCDFKPNIDGQSGDLEFLAGDWIRVLRRTEKTNDWWFGECHGKQGKFPASRTRVPADFFATTEHLYVDPSESEVADATSQAYNRVERQRNDTAPYGSQDIKDYRFEQANKMNAFFPVPPSRNKSDPITSQPYDNERYDGYAVPPTSHNADLALPPRPRNNLKGIRDKFRKVFE